MSSLVATRPMCSVSICGGLGNQLFQYAAGRALALRTDSHLHLDLSFYDKRRHRGFELDKLPIEAEFTRPAGRLNVVRSGRRFLQKVFRTEKSYQELHYHYDQAFESVESPISLEGYFQSERYFSAYADTIRTELAIPRPQDGESLDIAKQMAEVTSTSLHIRRGDYITNAAASQTFAKCTIEYYVQAMEQIPGDDPVFVFSDDIRWAKQNLPAVKPLIFCEGKKERPALADLWLMTHAHHHIIANSSFSWWGAWLAGPQKGVTFAPQQWFNDPTVDDSDLIPSHWIRL